MECEPTPAKASFVLTLFGLLSGFAEVSKSPSADPASDQEATGACLLPTQRSLSSNLGLPECGKLSEATIIGANVIRLMATVVMGFALGRIGATERC